MKILGFNRVELIVREDQIRDAVAQFNELLGLIVKLLTVALLLRPVGTAFVDRAVTMFWIVPADPASTL